MSRAAAAELVAWLPELSRRQAAKAVGAGLTRISHHLTVEARHRPATTALRLLAVLNVPFKYARLVQEMRRRAARAVY